MKRKETEFYKKLVRQTNNLINFIINEDDKDIINNKDEMTEKNFGLFTLELTKVKVRALFNNKEMDVKYNIKIFDNLDPKNEKYLYAPFAKILSQYYMEEIIVEINSQVYNYYRKHIPGELINVISLDKENIKGLLSMLNISSENQEKMFNQLIKVDKNPFEDSELLDKLKEMADFCNIPYKDWNNQ